MADNKTSVIITADASQFERQLARVASLADSAGGRLTSAFKGVGLAMAGIGAGVGLSTLKDKFDSIIASAANLKKMADATGASVDNLSGLASIAKITATDMGLVETAMNKLSKGLHASDDDAKGFGKALDFIGLKLEDLRGKDPAQNFLTISKALNGLEEGTGKVAVGTALLGKQYTAIASYMHDVAQSGDLIAKTTDAQASAAKKYEEDLKRLTATKDALYKVISLSLVPAFDTLVLSLIGAKKEANSLLDAVKGFSDDGSIKAWGDKAVDVIAFVIEEFQLLKKIIGEISDPIERLGGKIYYHSATLEVLGSTESWSVKQQAFKDLNKEAGEYFSKLDREKAKNREPAELFGDRVKSARAQQMADSLGFSDIGKPAKKDASGFVAAPDPRNAKSSSSSAVDDYTKLIQSINQKIAVEQANIDTLGKLGQAEKDYAKYQADVASGALKLTDSQKAVAGAYWEVYLARDKQRQFAEGVEKQTEANRLQVMAMEDQIRALDTQAEQYGLTERAINSMTEARLEEAIAIARSKDVDEESIAVLEKELLLRQKLGKAMENRDTSAILSQTEDAKSAKKDADKALLDRKLAARDISQRQYEQGMKVIEGELDTMGEFAKRAAQNMQDAMAEFFIDPTAKGMQSIAESFGKAVQKMIAQAAAAQLGKLLFGDMDKSGNLGGWIEKLFGAFGSSGVSSGAPAYDYAAFDALISGFANGGIMTSAGPLHLKSYAGGGIANTPQLSLFGEGRTPEAYVPLPDGKRIPVHMQGGNSPNITVHVNSQTGDPAEIRRSAAAGARTALGFMSGSRRYA